ncbi:MAG: DUF6132 family protein [Eubacteriales bacterium]|nr:DUF6132 family protein [Eubacteriales bacterium]
MKQSILKIIKNHLSVIIGITVGMVAGYLYFRFMGCAGGTCIITSSPISSTLYGGVLGWLVGSVAGGGCFFCSGGSCKTNNNSEQ